MGNTTGVVSASLRPEVIVRVGNSAQHKPGENIGYSLDSGRTWMPTVGSPTATSRAGSIAVSADGGTWIWTPEREAASLTKNQGATWTAVEGLPTGLRVVADTVDPKLFYAISLNDQTIYRSTDSRFRLLRPFLMPRTFLLDEAITVEARIASMPRPGTQETFGWQRSTGSTTPLRPGMAPAPASRSHICQAWRRSTRSALARQRQRSLILLSTWWGPFTGSAASFGPSTKRARG